MQTSPLGNLLHPHSDRIAVQATRVRSATPCKLGTYSCTYTMATSVGGYGGISALQLTSSRILNAKSESLLPQSENSCVHNRVDIQNFLKTIYNKTEIDKDFLNYLFDHTLKTDDNILLNHLGNSTNLTIFFYVIHPSAPYGKTNKKLSFPPSLVINQTNDFFGTEPFLPPAKLQRLHFSFFCFNLWFSNFEFLGHLILNICNTHVGFINYLKGLVNGRSFNHEKGLEFLCRTFDLNHEVVRPPTNLDLICQVLESLPHCEVIFCPARSSLQFINGSSSSTANNSDVYAVVVICNENQSRYDIPDELHYFGSTFQLVNVMSDSMSDFCIRFGNNFSSWWITGNFAPCVLATWDEYFRLVDSLSRKWNVLLYMGNYLEMFNNLRKTMFFTRRDVVKCGDHMLPLSTDFVDTVYKCNFDQCQKSQSGDAQKMTAHVAAAPLISIVSFLTMQVKYNSRI